MNKENNSRIWRLLLGVGLLFISFISFISAFATGHELNIRNLETLIMFIIIFIHFTCGSLLVFYFDQSKNIFRKVLVLLLVLTVFSLIYLLYEISSIKIDGFINPFLILPLILLLLAAKILYNTAKNK